MNNSVTMIIKMVQTRSKLQTLTLCQCNIRCKGTVKAIPGRFKMESKMIETEYIFGMKNDEPAPFITQTAMHNIIDKMKCPIKTDDVFFMVILYLAN
jgi:hypothetical protein